MLAVLINVLENPIDIKNSHEQILNFTLYVVNVSKGFIPLEKFANSMANGEKDITIYIFDFPVNFFVAKQSSYKLELFFRGWEDWKFCYW